MRVPKKIVTQPILALTVWILPCNPVPDAYQTSQEPDAMVSCNLGGPGSITVGSAVPMRFTLKNDTQQRLHVLRWYTPLEGIRGEIFRVTRGDQELAYRGPLARRADPVEGDYLVLEAGERVTVDFDLTSVYDLSSAGNYTVEFVSKLHDVVSDADSVPRQKDEFRPLVLICKPLSLDIVAS